MRNPAVDTEPKECPAGSAAEPSPLAPLLAKPKRSDTVPDRPTSPGRRGFLSRALSTLPFVALAGSAVVGARPAEVTPDLQSLVGRTFMFWNKIDTRVYRVKKVLSSEQLNPIYAFTWMSDWLVYEDSNDKKVLGAGRVGHLLAKMNFDYDAAQRAR